jgi:class 3 adenylate cyclase/tetratricopeptide (TPR) repeat protein
VLRCPRCGEENSDRARFCIRCGAALAAPEPRGEERKIVSVLFVELGDVDERADPEDLKRELAPYHAHVQAVIEAFGGTVDKFMGPVVLGVFGAPTAHEDDPERAVRAALRLTGAVGDGPASVGPHAARVRIGIDTGEAVVARPGTGPQIGEAVTGDVVNTASRITGVAGAGEVVVGEPTFRATAHAFDYESREPVSVKGKAEPLALWRAVEARSRMGVDLRPKTPTPFIGRREERSLLEGAFRRVLNESSVQMVTVTGEPGVGKTRLVHELGLVVDEYPEMVRWRQGRCLPYGEGVSFWAFGEIVKGEAGILDSDPPEDASAKLAAALAHVDDTAERDWIRARLAPLAGAEASLDVPRDELFTAWRRFVEMMAVHAPTVLVFEDLQWADDALLEFIEYLADWVVGVPLLLCCTARPELYERHAAWGGGRRNASSISLPPLSPQETSMLLSALLERTVLPPDIRSTLLERSGGNPLYAEEFVRMLRDQGIVEAAAHERARPEADIAVPQTVQLLIGARLDTLAPDHKTLIQDAAVAGKVFWRGLVSSMGDLDPSRTTEMLHELIGREFVRPARTSSIKGEEEYAFWHVLVQDVAYGQIPRVVRGRKHLAVAAWIREVAGDRISDMSELLAHHYGEALRLSQATGETTDELRRMTGEALMMAGHRAKRLDTARAESFFRRARETLPEGLGERTHALADAADAAANAGRLDEAERDFLLAIEEFRALGDRCGLGETMARLAQSPTRSGEDARRLLREAIDILEPEGAGPELARASSRMAGHLYVAGDNAGAVAWSDKALALADEIGLQDEEVLALQYRGAARSQDGDEGGLEDLRRALRIGIEAGLGEETAIAYNNLALQVWSWVGPAEAVAVYEEMIAFCRVRGFAMLEMWAEGGTLDCLFDLGEWDRLVERAERMLEWDRSHGGTRVGIWALQMLAWVALRRGDLARARELMPETMERARAIGYAEYVAPVLMLAAELATIGGDADAAVALTDEFLGVSEGQPDLRRAFLPLAVRVLVAAGQIARASALVDADTHPATKRQKASVLTAHAVLAEATGDDDAAAARYAEAVASWTEYDFPLERGRCGLGAGRALLRLGRADEGVARLRDARAVLERLGASALAAEVDELLGGVGAPA